MRVFFVVTFCFLVTFCFGQNKLEFKINSINRIENKYKTEYIYEISYSVKNISSKEISFYLDKNKIESNATGSMSNAVIYRLYQDENTINAPVFNKPKELSPIEKEKYDAEMKKKIDSVMQLVNSYKTPAEYHLNYKRKLLQSQKTTLQPNEVITMKHNLTWNKLRTISYFDNEYYLDEKSKYYLDFSIYLLKKPFEKYLTKEEEKTIIQNPNFLEEHYISEKIEIYLN
ncbi:hypothetical protein [Flavobacterium sp. H122]|uniref:hypothetical protein n=1 Tax=Flavobacterium sp. H122 TaxID=2529860 RepID=UPI0010AAFCFE|nr:hypothetical protein [Flavobacterium sp. H122]